MSNFKLGYPTIQNAATVTTTHAGNEEKLAQGARGQTFELDAETSDCLTINYDLGSGNTATANYLAIMRAKLLAGAGCSGVRLRAATVSGTTLPITPTAWYDAGKGVTTIDGAVSQWNDQSGNGYHATQTTAAQRPLLSRSDNKENLAKYSENLLDASWIAYSGSVKNSATTYTNTALNGRVLMPIPTVVGQVYEMSVRARAISGNTAQTLQAAGATVTSVNITLTSTLATYTRQFTANATSVEVGIRDYNAAGWGQVEMTEIHIRRIGTDSTYIKTEAFPQYASTNGNPCLIFDGTDDSLDVNTLAGIFTGEDKAISLFAVAIDTLGTAANRSIFGCGNSVSANPLMDFRGTIAPASQSTYTKRDSASVTSFALTFNSGLQTAKVLSIVDTGTSGKAYIDGVQAGSTTVTDIATLGTLDRGSIGALSRTTKANFWAGRICELIIFNTALSDANRALIEAYLTAKYITAPIASVDFPATYNGGQGDDYITTFTESAAYRHWWLELVNNYTTTNYKTSKVFFGKALDFGKEPLRPTNLNYTREQTHNRQPGYNVQINLDGVLDMPKQTFLNEVIADSDYQPIVAIDENELFLNETGGFHAKITAHQVEAKNTVENIISFTLEEEI